MKDTVFQQLMKPITKRLMKTCVARYDSDYDYETFKTYEHLQSMIYANIHEIKSLRVLEVAINSQKIGIKTKIKRSTLSDANAKRSAESFFWLLEQLMTSLPRKSKQEIKKVVRVLDSTPIQLIGLNDGWSHHYTTRGCQGLKLHIEYDLALKSPCQAQISYPNYNDCSMGQQWPILANTVYVFDKGYCDYNWWWHIHQQQAYFVTRLKRNTAVIKVKEIEQSSPLLTEDRIRFKNKCPRGGKKNLYTEDLRRIFVARPGKDPLVLTTNLMEVEAQEIARLYKDRWAIELFFKWIKQNLKIKKFLGKSENAVKIQLATALIAYLLLQLFQMKGRHGFSLQLTLVWIKHNIAKRKAMIRKQSPPRNQRILSYPQKNYSC